MFCLPNPISVKWLPVVSLAFAVTACGDSTDPSKPLQSSYALVTIDGNQVPFIYHQNQDVPESPMASRYVTRTIEHVAADTFVVSEMLDVVRTTDNTNFGYECTQRTVEMQRKGRYVIFKYYVPVPTVPSVGGMGGVVLLEAKYDTLTIEGDALVQKAAVIPGRVSRLVFKPGPAMVSCPGA